MVPQTLSRALLHLSLLSASLLLTGCPGLRDALPSLLAASQPDTASAHEFTLLGRNGGPAPAIPVIEPIHDRDDYRSYRIESAMSSIADLTHPHCVASLPISLHDIALLRNDPYLAVPSAPIPMAWRVAEFTKPINAGDWHRRFNGESFTIDHSPFHKNYKW